MLAVELADAACARGVTVVVGPTPQDRIEHTDELIEREVRPVALGHLLDAVLDLTERPLARKAVGDRRSSLLRASLDAKPEQVEAVVNMGDQRLLGRERQTQLLSQQHGRLFLERLGLGAGATHQDHEVIREADHSIAGLALCPGTRAFLGGLRAPGPPDAAADPPPAPPPAAAGKRN